MIHIKMIENEITHMTLQLLYLFNKGGSYFIKDPERMLGGR